MVLDVVFKLLCQMSPRHFIHLRSKLLHSIDQNFIVFYKKMWYFLQILASIRILTVISLPSILAFFSFVRKHLTYL